MKRLAIFIMCGIMLFSFSVFAQRIQPRPTPKPVLYSIEDDANGNFFMFDETTGEYKFIRCRDGAKLSGYGLVKETAEGIYTFEHIQPDRRIVFSCNLNTMQGKGFVETYSRITWRYDFEPISESLYDSNMDNNLMDCAQK